jgi:hypothetical protein
VVIVGAAKKLPSVAKQVAENGEAPWALKEKPSLSG